MKKLFRSREKLFMFLVLLTFLLVCIGPIFFLPDLRGGISNKAENVYRKMQKVAPDIILPENGFVRNHGSKDKVDIHVIEDRQRLQDKIRNEVIEKPNILSTSTPKEVKSSSESTDLKFQVKVLERSVIQRGQDPDPEIDMKRQKVKEMTLHAWKGYKAYAWGKNELRPISKRGHNAGIFGRQDMGATIIDAMDTLYIMNLMDEFNEGREWIKNHLDFNQVKSELSVFETNIRFIGGLLTLYAFTGDSLYRDKSTHIAHKLLPAFETPTGIPYGLINVANGISKNYAWASGGASILSEFGTLHLEFSYLSDISGDPVFREKVVHIRDVVNGLEKPSGLYPNYLNPKTGSWGQKHTSLGALGDSFYEYLLKTYIQSGRQDDVARNMYEEAIKTIVDRLVLKSRSGLTYIAESKFDRLEHKMDHLACFSAGMFALGAKVIQNENSESHLKLGAELANTCHESYVRSSTGLGPESFRFTEAIEAKALKSSEKYYILRPEVIEGWFYMWRFTHDIKYREWAWQAVLALEKHCRVETGFSGIQNVYSSEPIKDDVQQSFLFAETFKYLYLIFSDDSLLSLDDWVFNSEAHPLPIVGTKFYRAEPGTDLGNVKASQIE